MTRRTISLFPIVGLALSMLSGCATMDTKINMFPKVYEQRPATILVMPPMNESTSPEAKEFLECTLMPPLAEMGYYVVPVGIANEILKDEGVYDSEIMNDSVLPKLAEYFGADAVLWTTIRKWDKTYAVLAGNVEVSLDYKLQSTRTGEVLWNYDGELKVDTSGDSGGAGGLAGLLVKAVTAAISTATTDYVPIARKVNVMVLDTMPAGQYHALYDKDQKLQVKVK
jgi:hypothetical protein